MEAFEEYWKYSKAKSEILGKPSANGNNNCSDSGTKPKGQNQGLDQDERFFDIWSTAHSFSGPVHSSVGI